MKKITLILFIFALFSCTTTQIKHTNEDYTEPSWFTDPYSDFSNENYIVFVAKGNSFPDAESQIIRAAKKYRDYAQLKLQKEHHEPGRGYYLLYTLTISDLNDSLYELWSKKLNEYVTAVNDADSTSNILGKYSGYKKAINIYKQLDMFNKIHPDIQFSIPYEVEGDYQFLLEKFEMTNNEIEFSVNVEGDIDNLIKDSIEEELHNLGYITSENGLIQLNATLTLSDVALNNKYINKYWAITLSISDFDGYSSKSISFKGRESQISEEALNQSIARSVVKHVEDSIPKMLP